MYEILGDDHPRVQEARTRWERRASRKIAISFDRFLALLKRGATFRQIAKLGKVRPQAAEYYYNKVFRDLVGGVTGLQRRSINRLIHEPAVFPLAKRPPQLQAMALKLEEMGSEVTFLPSLLLSKYAARGGYQLHANLLAVNGHRCSFHCVTRQTKHGRDWGYAHLAVNWSVEATNKVDTLLVHIAIPQVPAMTYVLPLRHFIRAYPSMIEKKTACTAFTDREAAGVQQPQATIGLLAVPRSMGPPSVTYRSRGLIEPYSRRASSTALLFVELRGSWSIVDSD